MKNRKVALELSDKNFEKVMLRSLVWAGSKLSIEASVDNKNSAEYIITDNLNYVDDFNCIIYLIDDMDDESLDGKPYKVCKYSGGSELLSKIFYIISEGNLMTGPISNCYSIGFSSVEGGAGVTTVALSIGILLQRYFDKKVLYVPIMPLNYMKVFGNNIKNSSNDLYSKVLYTILEKRQPNFELVLQQFDEVDILSTPAYNHRWDEFDSGLKLNLELAASELGYDVIIYDFGNHVSRYTFELCGDITRNFIVLNHCEFDSSHDFFSGKVCIKNKKMLEETTLKGSDAYDIGLYNLNSIKALDEEFGLDVIKIARSICADDGQFLT